MSSKSVVSDRPQALDAAHATPTKIKQRSEREAPSARACEDNPWDDDNLNLSDEPRELRARRCSASSIPARSANQFARLHA
jgi:hypothetical protein